MKRYSLYDACERAAWCAKFGSHFKNNNDNNTALQLLKNCYTTI